MVISGLAPRILTRNILRKTCNVLHAGVLLDVCPSQ